MKRGGGSSSLGRSTAREKQRRDHMKELCNKLSSLLCLQSYDTLTMLAKATILFTQWKERVERLAARKQELENELRAAASNEPNLLGVQMSEMDSNLEVNLHIKTNNKKVELSRVLSIIEQGGAEIMTCNFSSKGHHTHYTIHAKAFQTRVGFDTSQIEYRLKQFVS